MRVRDSGMPKENVWNNFFDIGLILKELEIDSKIDTLAEIGSGYGTFTIPIAERINGRLYAFDIDKKMISSLLKKIDGANALNILVEKKDVLRDTTGLPIESVDYVILFNILHNKSPGEFLKESYRILKPKGKIGIIHWRSDIPTPRGPNLSIRPKPEEVINIIDLEKFKIHRMPFIIEPFHYGIMISKRQLAI